MKTSKRGLSSACPSSLWGAALCLVLLGLPTLAHTYGEPINGFPSWYERTIHMLTNRARCDPQADLAGCTVCAEMACYAPVAPVQWHERLNHSARFHAANLSSAACGMLHDSPCQLVTDIGTLYPASCDGSETCACQGGDASCSGGTAWNVRIGYFFSGGAAENIAWYGNPEQVFYAWLREPSSTTACTWTTENGHRVNILNGNYSVLGVGGQGGYTVQNFGRTTLTEAIPSGSHLPQTGTSISFRANWYHTAAPASALVNVGGSCQTMSLERGSATNGTFAFTGNVSGCTRYYFVFTDANGVERSYPSTGSFGVNCTDDWSATRPTAGAGCNCTPNCTGKVCGDNGCGGSCGTCSNAQLCSNGQCSCPFPACGAACCTTGQSCTASGCCTPNCSGKSCGDDGCGGSCGSCAAGVPCYQNQCGCPFVACNESCCAQGQVCNAGACCTPDCSGKVCGSNGCGGTCGSCSAPLVCVAGACDCASPSELCSGSCTDTTWNPSHCGACDNVCAAALVCNEGACEADCDPGLTQCNAACVDTQTNHDYCGRCNRSCNANQWCIDGRCSNSPPPPVDEPAEDVAPEDLSPSDVAQDLAEQPLEPWTDDGPSDLIDANDLAPDSGDQAAELDTPDSSPPLDLATDLSQPEADASTPQPSPNSEEGCGCASSRPTTNPWAAIGLAFLALILARRRTR